MGMIANFIRLDDVTVAGLLDDPPKIHDFFDNISYENSNMLDIDKAWSAIQFVLAGDPFDGEMPLGFIMSGPPIGDEDVGMGPALAKRASEVKEIADALRPITEEIFRDKFDHAALVQNDVYSMSGNPVDDLDYVLACYVPLREFILEAAEADEALIHYIC